MNPSFKIGDVVKVSEFVDCIYGVNQNMRTYIGKYVHIVNVSWQSSHGAFKYEIEEDFGRYWWSDECFEYEDCLDLPEFCAAGSADLNSLFV